MAVIGSPFPGCDTESQVSGWMAVNCLLKIRPEDKVLSHKTVWGIPVAGGNGVPLRIHKIANIRIQGFLKMIEYGVCAYKVGFIGLDQGFL